MSFDINLLEVLLAAAVAWGALRAEIAYRRWYARRQRPRARPVSLPTNIRVKSTIVGAVNAITSSCGHRSKDYVELTDGTRRCLACHYEGVGVA